MVPNLLKKRRPMHLVVVASIAAIAGSIFAAPVAKADAIADWTFETSAPATAGSFSPEVGAGSATGSHSGAAVYSSPVGNGSSHSFSSTAWNVGDYYQFQVSLTGFTGAQISFDHTSSNTGPRDFQIQYSTNGTSFTNFGSVYSVLANSSPNTPWTGSTVNPAYSLAFDLSSITALNNAANVYFRLSDASTVSANGGTVAAGGTDRVDNFTVTATAASPVPLPGILPATLAGLGLAGISNLTKRNRRMA